MDRVSATDVDLALLLADVATAAALPFVADVVEHEAKADGSPVSKADWAAEAAMLEVLARERPDDGVLSEESGQVATSTEGRRWLLDPIDGTVQFVSGGLEWGTHVALEVDGRVVLGVITRPRRSQRWWAATGWGAFTEPAGSSTDGSSSDGPQALAVSTTESLRGARIGQYALGPSPVPRLLAAAGAEVVTTGSHVLELAEGRLDAVVAYQCGFAWDHAPAVALAREAGGRFVDPTGGESCALRGGVYANAHLLDELLAVLSDAGVALAYTAP